MHKRQAIREAVVATLGAVPTLQGRVHSNRVRKTQVSELPVVLVYTLQEQQQARALGNTLYRRLSLVIEIREKALDHLDDKLDGLCSLVEIAMGADPRFGVVASDSSLTTTQIGLTGEGEERFAVALLTYDVGYVTAPGDPND